MKRNYRSEAEKKALVEEFNKDWNGRVADFCKAKGIYPSLLRGWRKALDRIEPAREVVHKSNGNGAELKQLRVENQRLKLLLAEKCLDVQSLTEYCGKVA